MSNDAATIIDMRDVEIEYRNPDYGVSHRVVIDDLRIGKGEFAVISGPSGCGKTTLSNVFACLKRPRSARRFEIADENIEALWCDRQKSDRFRREVLGIARQQVELSASLTVRENIELPLSLSGRSDDKFVNEVLSRLSNPQTRDLVRLQHKVVHRVALSGGQRQRIGLSRSVVNSPGLLLADEPTGNLDPHMAERVVEFLNELRQRNGMTIVAVTHQPWHFDEYATQYIEMACPQPGLGVIHRIVPGRAFESANQFASPQKEL